jgi:hypothetical protein
VASIPEQVVIQGIQLLFDRGPDPDAHSLHNGVQVHVELDAPNLEAAQRRAFTFERQIQAWLTVVVGLPVEVRFHGMSWAEEGEHYVAATVCPSYSIMPSDTDARPPGLSQAEQDAIIAAIAVSPRLQRIVDLIRDGEIALLNRNLEIAQSRFSHAIEGLWYEASEGTRLAWKRLPELVLLAGLGLSPKDREKLAEEIGGARLVVAHHNPDHQPANFSEAVVKSRDLCLRAFRAVALGARLSGQQSPPSLHLEPLARELQPGVLGDGAHLVLGGAVGDGGLVGTSTVRSQNPSRAR